MRHTARDESFFGKALALWVGWCSTLQCWVKMNFGIIDSRSVLGLSIPVAKIVLLIQSRK